MLVIALSGSLVYVLLNDSKEVTDNNPGDYVSYQFQDIEGMKKAESIEEAYLKIFGENRLYENNPHFDREDAIYNEKGIFYGDTYVYLLIEMETGIDTRMEMIDFLHYLQYSDLTSNETVDGFASNRGSGEDFIVDMRVFQPVKPGMNTPKPHQIWRVSSSVLSVMDFSDKETMLNDIHQYGNFEGVNPSGMN